MSTPGTPERPVTSTCGSARKKPLGKVTRASPRKYPLTAVGNDRYSAPVRILDVSLSAVMISPAFHRYTALSYRPTTAGRASEMRVPDGWDFTIPFMLRSTRKYCVLPVPSIPVTRTISPPNFASNGNMPAYFAVPESIHGGPDTVRTVSVGDPASAENASSETSVSARFGSRGPSFSASSAASGSTRPTVQRPAPDRLDR